MNPHPAARVRSAGLPEPTTAILRPTAAHGTTVRLTRGHRESLEAFRTRAEAHRTTLPHTTYPPVYCLTVSPRP